jgi:hypothetical protein
MVKEIVDKLSKTSSSNGRQLPITCFLDEYDLRGSMRGELSDAIPESEIFVCCLTDLYCQKVQARDGNYCSFEFEWGITCLKANNMIVLALEKDMKKPENWKNRIRSEFPSQLLLDMTKWNDGYEEQERCLRQLVAEIERIRANQKN